VPVDLARAVEERRHEADLEVLLVIDPFAELHLERATLLDRRDPVIGDPLEQLAVARALRGGG
jgi:hypothetical protein